MSGSNSPQKPARPTDDATLFEPSEKESVHDGATVAQHSQIADDRTVGADAHDEDLATAFVSDESPAEGATLHDQAPESDDRTLVDNSETATPPASFPDDAAATTFEAEQQTAVPPSGDDQTVVADEAAHESERTLVEQSELPQGVTRTMPPRSSAPDATLVEDTAGATGSKGMSFEDRTAAMPSQGPTRPSVTVTSPGRAGKSPAGGDGRSGTQPQAAAGASFSDRYQLVENFAHGGLGNIWRAEDKSIRREVAFKELLPKALRNRAVVERFIEEAQITGQLEHPGIVPIYDLGFQDNGAPYYSMKLLKGGNMEKAIEAMHALPHGSSERQLAFIRLLRQFVAVCQAVAFAHDKGVLHRDLKPLNVMLGEFGETLVLDWGLAKLVDALGEHQVSSDRSDKNTPDDDFLNPAAQTETATAIVGAPSSPETATVIAPANISGEASVGGTEAPTQAGSSRGASVESRTQGATQGGRSQTQQRSTVAATSQRQVTTDRSAGSQTIMGQIMGTPAYMPPEQAKGLIDELDARTDIYSLGGILYKLLTNQQPVGRGKVNEVLKAVIEGRIRPPRGIDPTIPKPLEAICLKAMATAQADRYQKALDLSADVEAWLADEPVSVYPEPWYTRAWRWIRRHPTTVGTSAAALAVLALSWSIWSTVERHRIDGLRVAAQTKITAARQALDQSNFAKADSLLNEALGQVQTERELATLKSAIQNQLDDMVRLRDAAERERVAGVRNKAEQRLAEVQRAIEDQQDFAQARVLLTEVVTLLSPEAALSDLQRDAQTRLDAVNTTLAQRAELDAAKAALAQFDNEVEQTRIFGGRLSGDDSIDDSREAQKHGLAALEVFPIDFVQPDKLDPRLKLLSETEIPKTPGETADMRWRLGMLETLLTLARLEDTLAHKDDPDELRAAWRRALQRVEQAQQLGVESTPLFLLKGDLHAQLAETDAADAAYERAKQLSPKTRFDHFTLGERARYQRQYDDALRHYQDALRVDADDFWSLYLMGLCHLQAGRPAAAAVSYTASIARRPNFAFAYIVRGYVFALLQQFDNAQRDFAKALELEPNSYHAILNRGAAHFLAKDYDAAQADFEQAATLKPDQAAPLINLAEVAWHKGGQIAQNDPAADASIRAAAEYQRALATLTKAVQISPQQGVLYFTRGRVQLSLNDPVAALSDFERSRVLETNPLRRAEASKEVGRVHHRGNRLAAALAAYEDSLALNPDDAEVIRLRAEALLGLGRDAEAIAAFTNYLEKAGPVGDVYRARGLALAKQKKYREAINDYTMSLQYEPSPNMLTRRGWAYLLEAAKLAKEDFEEAVRLNPQNPDSYQGLGYAKVMLGDYAGAVADAEKPIAGIKQAARQLGPQAWPLLFNPATIYSQAVGKVLIDPKLSAERREQLAAQYATRAIELLTDASKLAGQPQRAVFVQTLRTDAALDPIRSRTEFLEALKTLDPESPLNKPSKSDEKSPKD